MHPGLSSESQVSAVLFETQFPATHHFGLPLQSERDEASTWADETRPTPRLPKVMGARSWTTSLVYGEPKDFGRLPHPAGRLGREVFEGFVFSWRKRRTGRHAMGNTQIE